MREVLYLISSFYVDEMIGFDVLWKIIRNDNGLLKERWAEK